MKPENITRINALAAKSRTPEGLSDEEKQEQASLRQEYIASMKASLQTQLEHTVIVDENGTRTPLTKKEK
ncbi:MAG: DUF896 domain-containing protein [Ruthenibacterium sp.]